jgi:hypothetical protein
LLSFTEEGAAAEAAAAEEATGKDEGSVVVNEEGEASLGEAFEGQLLARGHTPEQVAHLAILFNAGQQQA